MGNVVVVGAQWGDEGKGKIVDWLSNRADVVVRFQGGHNAGHTLLVGNVEYKLSLLPSGVVRPGKLSIIGNGVVVDPWALVAEIEVMRGKGLDISPQNLRLADNAALILPSHGALDRAREERRGDQKIGTTGRGIGPAYSDKAARMGIRVQDLLDPGILCQKLELVLREKNQVLTKVIGIVKAYTTRVGSGPFPTEQTGPEGEWLRKAGQEYGVTTGRPRRTGWFDAVIARYATRVNGITDYFLTKLDVLSSLETVPVCVGYRVDGKETSEMPMTQSDLHRAEPIYEELPGWWEDISEAREFDDLPAKARDYVLRLEELGGAHISCIGVGPGREQTIVRRDVLAARP